MNYVLDSQLYTLCHRAMKDLDHILRGTGAGNPLGFLLDTKQRCCFSVKRDSYESESFGRLVFLLCFRVYGLRGIIGFLRGWRNPCLKREILLDLMFCC